MLPKGGAAAVGNRFGLTLAPRFAQTAHSSKAITEIVSKASVPLKSSQEAGNQQTGMATTPCIPVPALLPMVSGSSSSSTSTLSPVSQLSNTTSSPPPQPCSSAPPVMSSTTENVSDRISTLSTIAITSTATAVPSQLSNSDGLHDYQHYADDLHHNTFDDLMSQANAGQKVAYLAGVDAANGNDGNSCIDGSAGELVENGTGAEQPVCTSQGQAEYTWPIWQNTVAGSNGSGLWTKPRCSANIFGKTKSDGRVSKRVGKKHGDKPAFLIPDQSADEFLARCQQEAMGSAPPEEDEDIMSITAGFSELDCSDWAADARRQARGVLFLTKQPEIQPMMPVGTNLGSLNENGKRSADEAQWSGYNACGASPDNSQEHKRPRIWERGQSWHLWEIERDDTSQDSKIFAADFGFITSNEILPQQPLPVWSMEDVSTAFESCAQLGPEIPTTDVREATGMQIFVVSGVFELNELCQGSIPMTTSSNDQDEQIKDEDESTSLPAQPKHMVNLQGSVGKAAKVYKKGNGSRVEPYNRPANRD